MKKIYLFALLIMYLGTVKAQYTKLLDFNNSNGSQPFGSVIPDANDSVLYGMTNDNKLFSLHTDGTGLIEYTMTDIVNPYGSLIRAGNILYGMCSGGGPKGSGGIFSIHTDLTGYANLHYFSGDSISGDSLVGTAFGGAVPDGTLTISGNVLYGMTYGAGGPDRGNIFSINTNGTGYLNLYSFHGSDGQFPGYGALVVSGNTMYGTTLYGGASGDGVLFSMHTDGTGFTDILNFNSANGDMPFGSVVISGNTIFGCTDGGGLYGKGRIFSLHSDGTGYRDLFDFNTTNGQGPMGTLILSGTNLYGTTAGGGTNNLGTVFSIDTSGSNFQNLLNFDTPNGTQPRATLSMIGARLYGTCVIGGTYGDGTVFSLLTQPPVIPICMVTVNDSSMSNVIMWQKPVSTNIDSFIVFRETTTNNYEQIGAVPYAALSEFEDTVAAKYFPFTGNPNAGTYRYKLQVRYIDGSYSRLSPYHNTLFATQSGGTFNWNQYTIEGDSVPLPTLSAYILYRDDNSTGAWHQVVGVSGTQTTATDPNYNSYPNGSWRVETNWGITCTPTRSTTSGFNASKSNVKGSLIAGIKPESLSSGVKVFPIPATNALNITGITQKTSVKLIDLVGKVVFDSEIERNITIDINYLPQGVYTLVTEGPVRSFHKVIVTK
jgi:uncharacterized repeat protein (TIGR03803 family)